MAEHPSLGDSPQPDLVLSRYSEPLPGSRREIVAKFESILNRGGIQKVTVSVGKPIEVVQLVDKATMAPPVDMPSDDLWDVVRNAGLEELKVKNAYGIPDGYELLFHAFAELEKRKLKPKMLFVQDLSVLRTWLRLPTNFPVAAVYGVETAKQANAPEDAVILMGVPFDEEDLLSSLGLRIPVDLPTPQVTVLRKGKS